MLQNAIGLSEPKTKEIAIALSRYAEDSEAAVWNMQLMASVDGLRRSFLFFTDTMSRLTPVSSISSRIIRFERQLSEAWDNMGKGLHHLRTLVTAQLKGIEPNTEHKQLLGDAEAHLGKAAWVLYCSLSCYAAIW